MLSVRVIIFAPFFDSLGRNQHRERISFRLQNVCKFSCWLGFFFISLLLLPLCMSCGCYVVDDLFCVKCSFAISLDCVCIYADRKPATEQQLAAEMEST